MEDWMQGSGDKNLSLRAAEGGEAISINRLYKSPYRVIIAIITIWAFLFNTVGMELAWAYNPKGSVLSRTGTGAQDSSGHFFDLNEFRLPSSVGEVKETYLGTNGKTVIHIQDAHCNYSAQNSIKNIVSYLNKDYGVNLIGLEGGEGDYDLSVFTKIQDLDLREKVADYFVKEGRINGAELFAILNPDSVKLKGLEKANLYIKNLNIYRESLKHKPEIDKALNSLSNHITTQKQKTYSKTLLELDQKSTQYHNQELELKEYLNYILSLRASIANEVISQPNLIHLIEIIEEEKDISFKTCEREREELINDIKRSISKLELEILLKFSLDFKNGLIREDEFYLYLLEKAKFCGFDAEKCYPNLIKFSKFLKKYNSLDKYKVFNELKEFEEIIFNNLAKDEKQKKLYQLSNDLNILKKFFSVSLTRDEFDYYNKNKERIILSLRTIDAEGVNVEAISIILNNYCRNFEQFYTYSLKRDKAFLTNLKRYMKTTNEAILYTGGFHTENLKELLKNEGYSYIVVLPKFDPKEETPYFSLLSGEFKSREKQIKSYISSLMIASSSTPLAKAYPEYVITEYEVERLLNAFIDNTAPTEEVSRASPAAGEWESKFIRTSPSEDRRKDATRSSSAKRRGKGSKQTESKKFRAKELQEKQKARRRFLKKAATVAGTTALLGIGGWLVWDNLRDKKPWEKFPDIDNYSLERRDRFNAVRETVLLILDWMIGEGYPHPEVLEKYAEVVRKNSRDFTIEESESNLLMSKDISIGEIQINSNLMAQFLKTIKKYKAQDQFIELTMILEREAWGLCVAPVFDSIVGPKKIIERTETLINLSDTNLYWPSKEMEKFLNTEGVEEEIIDITAAWTACEAYETYREYYAMERLIQNGSYSIQRARKTHNMMVNSERSLRASLEGWRKHIDDIYNTRGDLNKIIQKELDVFIFNAFAFKARHAITIALSYYAFAEFKRFKDTDGSQGLDYSVVSRLMKAGYMFPTALFKSSSERIRPKVEQILLDADEQLPQEQRLFSQGLPRSSPTERNKDTASTKKSRKIKLFTIIGAIFLTTSIVISAIIYNLEKPQKIEPIETVKKPQVTKPIEKPPSEIAEQTPQITKEKYEEPWEKRAEKLKLVEQYYTEISYDPFGLQKRDGSATLRTKTTSRQKEIVLVSGTHGSQKALNLACRFLENKIKKGEFDPDEWLFLIEGGPEKIGPFGIPEHTFLIKISQEFDITIEDPIVFIFNTEILQKAAETLGMDIDKIYFYLIEGDIILGQEREWTLRKYARYWNVDYDKLSEIYRKEKAKAPSDTEVYLRYLKVHEALIDISNEKSEELLRNRIKGEEKNILFLIGRGHNIVIYRLFGISDWQKFGIRKPVLPKISESDSQMDKMEAELRLRSLINSRDNWFLEEYPRLTREDFIGSPRGFERAFKFFYPEYFITSEHLNPDKYEEIARKFKKKGEPAAAAINQLRQAAHIVKKEFKRERRNSPRYVADIIVPILRKAAINRAGYSEKQHQVLVLLTSNAEDFVEILWRKYEEYIIVEEAIKSQKDEANRGGKKQGHLSPASTSPSESDHKTKSVSKTPLWRRMLQFRLRSLFILTTIIALAIGSFIYRYGRIEFFMGKKAREHVEKEILDSPNLKVLKEARKQSEHREKDFEDLKQEEWRFQEELDVEIFPKLAKVDLLNNETWKIKEADIEHIKWYMQAGWMELQEGLIEIKLKDEREILYATRNNQKQPIRLIKGPNESKVDMFKRCLSEMETILQNVKKENIDIYPDEYGEAFRIVQTYGRHAYGGLATDELINVLNDKSKIPEFRAASARLLSYIYESAKPAIPHLIKALKSDESPSVRFQVSDALASLLYHLKRDLDPKTKNDMTEALKTAIKNDSELLREIEENNPIMTNIGSFIDDIKKEEDSQKAAPTRDTKGAVRSSSAQNPPLRDGEWRILADLPQLGIYRVIWKGKNIFILAEQHLADAANTTTEKALELILREGDPTLWHFILEGDISRPPLLGKTAREAGKVSRLPGGYKGLVDLVTSNEISAKEAVITRGIGSLELIGWGIREGIYERRLPMRVACEEIMSWAGRYDVNIGNMNIASLQHLLASALTNLGVRRKTMQNHKRISSLMLERSNLQHADIVRKALQSDHPYYFIRIGILHISALGEYEQFGEQTKERIKKSQTGQSNFIDTALNYQEAMETDLKELDQGIPRSSSASAERKDSTTPTKEPTPGSENQLKIQWLKDAEAHKLTMEVCRALGRDRFDYYKPIVIGNKEYVYGSKHTPFGEEVVRLGPLVFVSIPGDRSGIKYDWSRPEAAKERIDSIKDRLGDLYLSNKGNVIIIHPSPFTFWPVALDQFQRMTIASMLARAELFENAVVYDEGSGDALLSRIALRLGADRVVLIEKGALEHELAHIFLNADGIGKEDIDKGRIIVLEKNLTDPSLKDLLPKYHLPNKPVVALANIGPHKIYGNANRVAVDLVREWPNLTLLINGGYYVGRSEENQESDLSQIMAKLEAQGFMVEKNVETEQSGCALIATRSKDYRSEHSGETLADVPDKDIHNTTSPLTSNQREILDCVEAAKQDNVTWFQWYEAKRNSVERLIASELEWSALNLLDNDWVGADKMVGEILLREVPSKVIPILKKTISNLRGLARDRAFLILERINHPDARSLYQELSGGRKPIDFESLQGSVVKSKDGEEYTLGVNTQMNIETLDNDPAHIIIFLLAKNPLTRPPNWDLATFMGLIYFGERYHRHDSRIVGFIDFRLKDWNPERKYDVINLENVDFTPVKGRGLFKAALNKITGVMAEGTILMASDIRHEDTLSSISEGRSFKETLFGQLLGNNGFHLIEERRDYGPRAQQVVYVKGSQESIGDFRYLNTYDQPFNDSYAAVGFERQLEEISQKEEADEWRLDEDGLKNIDPEGEFKHAGVREICIIPEATLQQWATVSKGWGEKDATYWSHISNKPGYISTARKDKDRSYLILTNKQLDLLREASSADRQYWRQNILVRRKYAYQYLEYDYQRWVPLPSSIRLSPISKEIKTPRSSTASTDSENTIISLAREINVNGVARIIKLLLEHDAVHGVSILNQKELRKRIFGGVFIKKFSPDLVADLHKNLLEMRAPGQTYDIFIATPKIADNLETKKAIMTEIPKFLCILPHHSDEELGADVLILDAESFVEANKAARSITADDRDKIDTSLISAVDVYFNNLPEEQRRSEEIKNILILFTLGKISIFQTIGFLMSLGLDEEAAREIVLNYFGNEEEVIDNRQISDNERNALLQEMTDKGYLKRDILTNISDMCSDINTISITQGCSHSCKHCYFEAKRRVKVMPFNRIIGLLEAAKKERKQKGLDVTILDGESITLYWDSETFDYYDPAHDADAGDVCEEILRCFPNQKIHITTRGWYIGDKIAQRAAHKIRKLAEDHPDQISLRLSVDLYDTRAGITSYIRRMVNFLDFFATVPVLLNISADHSNKTATEKVLGIIFTLTINRKINFADGIEEAHFVSPWGRASNLPSEATYDVGAGRYGYIFYPDGNVAYSRELKDGRKTSKAGTIIYEYHQLENTDMSLWDPSEAIMADIPKAKHKLRNNSIERSFSKTLQLSDAVSPNNREESQVQASSSPTMVSKDTAPGGKAQGASHSSPVDETSSNKVKTDLSRLKRGVTYLHEIYGKVKLIEVSPNEDKITIETLQLPDLGSLITSETEDLLNLRSFVGRRLIIPASGRKIVPYFKPGTKEVTREAQSLIRQMARKRYVEKFVPLLFGFNVVARRIKKSDNVQGYYADVLSRVHQQFFNTPNYSLEHLWDYIGRAEQEPIFHNFFKTLFKTIFVETGEDVILSGVLDSFGRHEAKGRSWAWVFPPEIHTERWPKFKSMPFQIDDYYRTWLLNGLKVFNEEDVFISDDEYEAISAKFNLHLAPYYKKKDPRHENDPFSQLILKIKDDISAVGKIFPLIRDQLRNLGTKELASVDLVVPAPSIYLHRNQTLPLADLVSRELNKPLSIMALNQIRKRKRQQKRINKLWRRALNAGGLFQGDRGELQDKVVVIVDDNETTGFTANSMKAAAYSAGAKKVYVLSFGKTVPRIQVRKNSGQLTVSGVTVLPADTIVYSYANMAKIILQSDVSFKKKAEALSVFAEKDRDIEILFPELLDLLDKLIIGEDTSYLDLIQQILELIAKALTKLITQKEWIASHEEQLKELKQILIQIIRTYLDKKGESQHLVGLQAAAIKTLSYLELAEEDIGLLMEIIDINDVNRHHRAEVVSVANVTLGNCGRQAKTSLNRLEALFKTAVKRFPQSARGYSIATDSIQNIGKILMDINNAGESIDIGDLDRFIKDIQSFYVARTRKNSLTDDQSKRINSTLEILKSLLPSEQRPSINTSPASAQEIIQSHIEIIENLIGPRESFNISVIAPSPEGLTPLLRASAALRRMTGRNGVKIYPVSRKIDTSAAFIFEEHGDSMILPEIRLSACVAHVYLDNELTEVEEQLYLAKTRLMLKELNIRHNRLTQAMAEIEVYMPATYVDKNTIQQRNDLDPVRTIDLDMEKKEYLERQSAA